MSGARKTAAPQYVAADNQKNNRLWFRLSEWNKADKGERVNHFLKKRYNGSQATR